MSLRIMPNQQDLQLIISKFIINLPLYQYRQDRIWYHFEKAFYYYIDQVINLQALTDFQLHDKQLKQFIKILHQKLPLFIQKRYDDNQLIKSINDAYSSIPIYGVIIFNLQQTKILMVEGHKPEGMYSIPKGKINQLQSGIQCALRQLKQQVGIRVQLSQKHKIQINYSKHCIFYLCKIQQCNINTKVLKNTILQKKNGRNNKKTSKQIKSLAWIHINTPQNNNNKIRFNHATKKALQKIKEEKKIKTINNNNGSNNNINNNNISNNIININNNSMLLVSSSCTSIDTLSSKNIKLIDEGNNKKNNLFTNNNNNNTNNKNNKNNYTQKKYKQIIKNNPFDQYYIYKPKYQKIFTISSIEKYQT